tara:strand:+ start:1888 stop:2352 length:465 start_codon:yes stop_codon:yes gene_type:complete
MATEHSTLTGSDLHEPKGTAAANADQIYIANGSGSGAWTNGDNNIYLTLELTDCSTASSTWLPSPCTGIITKVQTILHTVIASGNAAITVELNGTGVTGGAITIAHSGSAVGDIDTASPSDNRTLAVGTKVELISNGGSTNAARVTAVLTITPT